MADKRVVHLKSNEAPGPGNMCFHWLKPMHVCVLKPNHKGDHYHSKFTVTVNKEK